MSATARNIYLGRASFSLESRVLSLSNRISVRLAQNDGDLKDVYELRYKCYLSEGVIATNEHRFLTDAYDKEENTRVFSISMDGTLIASIRIHLLERRMRKSPSYETFFDLLDPYFDEGARIVDPTRFVIDRATSKTYPELVFHILRIPFLAATYGNADKAIATVRAEHRAFYKRVLMYRQISGPRAYLQLTSPLHLMIADFAEEKKAVAARFPFLAEENPLIKSIYGNIQ